MRAGRKVVFLLNPVKKINATKCIFTKRKTGQKNSIFQLIAPHIWETEKN